MLGNDENFCNDYSFCGFSFSILNIALLLGDVLWYGMQWVSVHRLFGSKVGCSSHSTNLTEVPESGAQ